MTHKNGTPKGADLQILAFDFGIKRIGVAVGQTLTATCQPLPEIRANNGIPDWNQLADLLNEWQPDCLLTGLPLNMDGSENTMCQRARKFARRLHGKFGLPSYMHDERLTSFSAKQFSPAENYKQHAVDSLAACAILNSWLDSGCPQKPG